MSEANLHGSEHQESKERTRPQLQEVFLSPPHRRSIAQPSGLWKGKEDHEQTFDHNASPLPTCQAEAEVSNHLPVGAKKRPIDEAYNSSQGWSGTSCANNVYLYQREEYDEGMSAYLQAAAIAPTHSDSFRITLLIYNAGITYVSSGNYVEAQQSFRISMRRTIIFDVDHPEIRLLIAKIHHNIGYCYYRLGQNNEAIQSYRNALTVVEEYQLGKFHLATTYNSIAVLMYHGEPVDTKDTLAYFKRSLCTFRNLGDRYAKELATTLNNIGRVFYLRGDYQEALHAYDESLSIRQNLVGINSIDILATVCNKGQAAHQRGQFAEALKCYEEFLFRAPQHLGSIHRDIATIYKCSAEIKHQQGYLNEAGKLYSKALQVGWMALGSTPEVASTLNRLGNLYYEMDDVENALQYYKEELKIEQSVLEPTHPHTIVTMTNIGHCHRRCGRYAVALIIYRQVYDLQVQALGPNCLDVANTLASMGMMEYLMKENRPAFELFQHTLRIQRDYYGSDDHLCIASTLNSIGLILFNQSSYDMSKKCFTDSLTIRRKILGPTHRDVAVLWYSLGTICLETGEEDEAIRLYMEALRVGKELEGESDNDAILILEHLGLAYQQRGELEEALGFFCRALALERTKVEKNPVAIAKLLNLIGNINLQCANVDQMMTTYSEASRIYRASEQPGNMLLIAGYNYYGLAKLHPPSAPAA